MLTDLIILMNIVAVLGLSFGTPGVPGDASPRLAPEASVASIATAVPADSSLGAAELLVLHDLLTTGDEKL